MIERIQLFLIQNRISISLFSISALILLFCSAFLPGIRNAARARRYDKRKRSERRSFLRKAYLYIMTEIDKVPFFSAVIENISYDYKCQDALTDEESYLETGRTLFWTASAAIIAFFFGMAWFKDIVISLMTGFIWGHLILQSCKSNVRAYLSNLDEAVEDFLLSFHRSSGNIDEAFFYVENTKNPVSRHFRIMHDYVKEGYIAEDPGEVQNRYNHIAPSRFLRNLYTVIFMTYKYGDEKRNGRSTLNANLLEIQEEINEALYQQNQIMDDTAGIRWFIILPIYFIPVLAAYMTKYFSAEGFNYIESFVNSSTGYLISVFCALVTLVCYLAYAHIIDRRILEPRTSVSWEKQLLKNRRFRRFVLKTLPEDSPKRKKISRELIQAGSLENIDSLQTRRILIAVIMTVLMMISVTFNTVSSRLYIYNSIYIGLDENYYRENILKSQEDYDQKCGYIDQMLEADKRAIKAMNETSGYYFKSSSEQEDVLREYLIYSGLGEIYRSDRYLEYGITRIRTKINYLNRTSGFSSFILVVLTFITGYAMPYLLIKTKAFLNKEILLFDETLDLQRMTIMLIEYPSMTDRGLLDWYVSSSMLYAPVFRRAKADNDVESIADAYDYKPFRLLVNSLIMARSGLTLKDAFEGVWQRTISQRKEQARNIESILKARASFANILSEITVYAVLGLYLMLPLIVTMVQMFYGIGMF